MRSAVGEWRVSLMTEDVTIGVLGLQGAFAKHLEVLSELGVAVRRVRLPADLNGLDGLVVPGGESTAMSHLLISSGLLDPLRSAVHQGLPVLGTCAGLIMVAHRILDGRPDQVSLDALDVTVRRNGYGRQVDSFESDLAVVGLDGSFHAVFIRAPVIEGLADSVEVLAELDSIPVLVRQGSIMASSFHPELTEDHRIHQLFLDLVRQSQGRWHSLQSDSGSDAQPDPQLSERQHLARVEN